MLNQTKLRIGFAILLALVAWAYSRYDLSAVVTSVKSADWRLVLAGAMLNVFLLYFRVFKWRFFFAAGHQVSFYHLSVAAFAAYSVNTAVPVRAGGLIQAWLLSTVEPIRMSAALGTVLLIRLIDGATIGVIGFVVVISMAGGTDDSALLSILQGGVYAMLVIFLTPLAILFALRKEPQFPSAWQGLFLRFAPREYKVVLGHSLNGLWGGAALLNRPPTLALVVGLNIIFWMLASCSVALFLLAFNVSNLSVTIPFIVLLAQLLGFLVPAPGAIGPYHAATVFALSFFGVTGEMALSIAIVMHGVMFVTNTAPGLLYLWIENLSIRDTHVKVAQALSDENGRTEK